jgi:hypothetical protein
MGFGGFCPLPIRLGGNSESGWTATQHARLCADLSALKRTTPLAVVTFTPDSVGGTVALHGYYGRDGVGSGFAPSISITGAGDCTINWDSAFVDDFDRVAPWNITMARGGIHSSAGGRMAFVPARNTVRVRTFTHAGAAVDHKVTVVVYGETRGDHTLATDAAIGDYGGATDKRDSVTEGSRPYAWTWYRELQAGRGSAYTTKSGTLVHAENLALARSHAAVTRAAEKLVANATPATADERLDYWREVMNLHVKPGEAKWQTRQNAAGRYRLASGPTRTNIDAACSALLGQAFVQTWHQTTANLEPAPPITFWKGGTLGPIGYDISGAGTTGVWLSERAHLTVEVQMPPGMSVDEFLYLCNVQLYDMLDRMMPAWATFDWALGPLSAGFLLDISSLDFNGITP